MSELYLICHKVRGEPAFDIAERCDEMGTDSDPGPWWIIPTSGHRAYPSDYIALSYLTSQAGETVLDHMAPPDESLPDHYHATPAPKGQGLGVEHLLSLIGIEKPTVSRRFG